MNANPLHEGAEQVEAGADPASDAPAERRACSGQSAPRYLRRRDAAAYLRANWGIPCAPAYLAKLAVTGGGPVFRKISRFPIYTAADLDDWALSRISPPVRSTSEIGELRGRR